MRLALALLALSAAGCQRTDSTSVADCARVAETLATFEIGTAASPEARAPVVAKHRTACETTKVTAAEAACLGRATDTWAARACLPRMFPPPPAGTGADNVAATACATVVDRMRVAVMQQVGSEGSAAEAVLDRMLPVIQSSCEQDRWPAAVLDCIARTKPGDMSGFQLCSAQLPKELQDKLEQKLRALQEKQAQAPAAPPAQ